MENIIQLMIAERDKIDMAIKVLRGPTFEFTLGPAEVEEAAEAIKGAIKVYDPSLGAASEPTKPHRHRTVKEKKTGRRGFTPAQREEARKRMQAYWAKKRKAAKK